MAARRASALVLSALLTLLAAAPARAASTFRIAVDPRIELLGVVQYLAGLRRPLPADASYLADIEAGFGALRGHPAVELYAAEVALRQGEEGYGIILLYYSDPPALTLRSAKLYPPYVEKEAEQQRAQRMLWELRDFARVSDFAKFYAEHSGFYSKTETAARALLGVDPMAVIEGYLGLGQETLDSYLISPLYTPTHWNSYILPYPDPASRHEPVRQFEVYTISPFVAGGVNLEAAFDQPSGFLWQEPLYVFIDPSFHFFERGQSDPAGLYPGDIAECRLNDINCAKSCVIAALVERLNIKAYGRPPDAGGLKPRPCVPALARRLEEYEGARSRYATLWDFYPRLFAAFGELAAPGRPAAVLTLPPLGLKTSLDFFSPQARRLLEDPEGRRLKDSGVKAFLEKRFSDAERELTAALTKMPQDAESLLNLGVVYEASGRSLEALDLFSRAIAAGAAQSDGAEAAAAALCARAAIFEKSGQRAQARADLERALRVAAEAWSGRDEASLRLKRLAAP